MSPSTKLFISTVRIYKKTLLNNDHFRAGQQLFQEGGERNILSKDNVPRQFPTAALDKDPMEVASQTVPGGPWDKRSSSAN